MRTIVKLRGTFNAYVAAVFKLQVKQPLRPRKLPVPLTFLRLSAKLLQFAPPVVSPQSRPAKCVLNRLGAVAPANMSDNVVNGPLVLTVIPDLAVPAPKLLIRVASVAIVLLLAVAVVRLSEVTIQVSKGPTLALRLARPERPER